MSTYAISNLAWDTTTEREAIFPQLRAHGFSGIEIAPTKLFPNFWDEKPSVDEVKDYRSMLEEEGFKAVALQSIIYGRPELKLFGTDRERADLLAALVEVFVLARDLGVRPLVFGSPKNRIKGNLETEEAMDVAVDFFMKAGIEAQNHGVTLCMEANPSEYGGDFIWSTKESLALVKRVDHPGFRLHLDTGGVYLAGDDIASVLADDLDLVDHFHVSNPFLQSFEDTPADHVTYGRILRESGYDKAISIEMLPPKNGTDGILKALCYVQKHY